MARQVLPIVSAAAGFWIGGAAGARWGYVIGSIVGNAVDPQVIQGPRIGDVAGQTSSEGVYQPIYFGTAAGSGNMIAQGPNIIKKVKEKQGKGGPVTVSERLYKTFAIRIGVGWNGPIAGISRIWEDEKLVYDIRPESTIVEESEKFAEGFRLYLGTEDQLPDPDLEAIYGIGNTPAYPGRAYIVFPKKDITDRRSISNYRFEVVSQGAVNSVAMLAFRRTLGVGYTMLLDADYSGTWVASPGLNTAAVGKALTMGDRVISYSDGNALPCRTDDLGANFTAATGAVSTYAKDQGWAVGDVVLMPGLLSTTDRSLDRGETFAAIAGSPRLIAIVAIQTRWIGISAIDAELLYSVDNGTTWSSPVAQPIVSGVNGGWATDDEAMFFGLNFGGDSIIIRTPDGVSVSAETIPTLTGQLRCIVEGNGLWVAGTEDGEIIYRDIDGVWHLSPDNFGEPCNGVTFNGIEFVMIGGTYSAGTEYGYIKTSPDGIEWTTRVSSTISSGETWPAIVSMPYSEEIISDTIPLSTIVSKIHGYVNQDSSKYDVTDLAGINVDGLILAGPYSAADAIRTLAGVYFFDSPEIDKKIVHRLRGAPVVHTFTIDDLVDEPEESTRGQAIEYPKKLHLDYQNAVIEYAPAKATSTRESQDIRVVGEANVQAPVVMDADTAAQKANVLHKIAWADLDGEVPFTVPDSFISLVPGDCVGLSLRGQVRRLRIDRQEYNHGTIKLYTRNDRQSAYTSNVTGVPVPTPTPPPPSITGPSRIEVLDIPALLDLHDQPAPVRYIAVGGLTPAWYGAAVQESLDAGANYTGLIDNFSPGTLMGTLLADVTDASTHYTDTTNVLHIQFDDADAEVDSLTDAQFLSEGGALAVENADGTWEVMQYRDADDLGDGEYTLSHLLRGRLNTETQAHLAGRRVVVLDGVRVVSTQSSYIGQSIVHRAISFGTAPETGVTDTITYEAQSQTEWPIASFTAERVSDTITGNIVPRHRFGTDDVPVRSTNWAGYRITYEQGGNVNSVVVLSDDFSLDVTGYGSPVDVTISQLNRITGAGPSVTESIV